jgi:hypothetical protein
MPRNAAGPGMTKHEHGLFLSTAYLLILGSFHGLQTPCPDVMTPLFRSGISVSIVSIKIMIPNRSIVLHNEELHNLHPMLLP